MRLTAADQMLAYILSHRDTDAPFDVAKPTLMPPDPAQAHDQAESLAAAGSTWLLEWQTQTDAVSTRIRALVQPVLGGKISSVSKPGHAASLTNPDTDVILAPHTPE